jgi:hypothetical protein
MEPHHLHREQVVARPLERVFPFFERPENLALITPPSLGFRVVTPGPVPMAEGTVIDYRIRLAGLPVRWRSVISAYEPPRFFVDEQLLGPYAYWRHEHRFEPLSGATRFVDDVYYRLPSLPPGVGCLARELFVAPYLERIFDYRADFYRRFFEADSWYEGSAYSLALLVACVIFILANMAIFKVGIRDIAK